MTASGIKEEFLLPLGMKDRLGQSFEFQKPAPIDIKNSKIERVYDNTYSADVCKVHVRARVRQNMVQYTIDGGTKGRNGENLRRGEAN